MRPLGVGVFTIRSYTRNYIIYWGNNYFGMYGLSIYRWMDLWLTEFCDYNHVSIIILFSSPSLRQPITHSCGCLWYLSRRQFIFLLLLTFLSFIFLSTVLFYVSWVCLGHTSNDEVSKYLENISLIWFSQEIPVHFTCGAPLHWHISLVNPVSYKKLWYWYVWCIYCLMTYHYFP